MKQVSFHSVGQIYLILRNSKNGTTVKRRTLLILILGSLACLMLFFGCGKKGGPSATKDWLVIVGQDTLTIREFEIRYQTTPHLGIGNVGRGQFLAAMVLESMLSQEREQSKNELARTVRLMKNELADEVRVEELLNSSISQRAVPTKEELSDYLERSKKTVPRCLDISKRRTGKNAYKTYQTDGKLPPMLKRRGRDGMEFYPDLPLVFSETEEVLEDVAYSLNLNEVGEPVYNDGKWWLIQLKSSEPIPAEKDTLSVEQVRSILVSRKRLREQFAFMAESLKGQSIDMDPALFQWLVQYLKAHLPAVDGTDAPPLPIVLPNKEIEPAFDDQAISDLLSKPMVTLKGLIEDTWTVRDVLERLYVCPKIMPSSASETFPNDIYGLVLWLVEFERMAQMAKSPEIADLPAVRQDIRIWQRHLVAQEELKQVIALDTVNWEKQPEDKIIDPFLLKAQDAAMQKWLAEHLQKYKFQFHLKPLKDLELSDSPSMIRKSISRRALPCLCLPATDGENG